MNEIPWYKSKTIWVNLATFLSIVLVLPELGAVVPESAVRYIALANALINVGLRVFADQSASVTLTAPKRSFGVVFAIGLTAAALGASACGGKPVVLVAQTGQTLAGAIGQAQHATARLMDAGVITPAQARVVQVRLLQANDRLKPLPDLLIAVDAATQAGQSDAARIDAALAILAAVGIDLDTVVAGLPVGETAADVLKATTEARKLIAQITAALARQKAENVTHVLPVAS